jgi:hypothetical protein
VTRLLRTEDEIRAAGAEAVKGWQLTDRQVDRLVAILTPVRDEVWRLIETSEHPTARPAA